jgi:hypothetical protein
LVVDKSGKLQVTSTQNQDNLDENALVQGLNFGFGFMEHAYYLLIPKKLHIDSMCQLAQSWREL